MEKTLKIKKNHRVFHRHQHQQQERACLRPPLVFFGFVCLLFAVMVFFPLLWLLPPPLPPLVASGVLSMYTHTRVLIAVLFYTRLDCCCCCFACTHCFLLLETVTVWSLFFNVCVCWIHVFEYCPCCFGFGCILFLLSCFSFLFHQHAFFSFFSFFLSFFFFFFY